MHVLVVDDNRELADNLGEVLTDEGLRCAVAYDAVAAAAEIGGGERPAFDLVITDLYMGASDGLAVIAAVRRRSVRTPVLLVTALPEGVRLGREQAAVFEVLAKPFDTRHLVALVHRCLRRVAVESSVVPTHVPAGGLRGRLRDLPCAP